MSLLAFPAAAQAPSLESAASDVAGLVQGIRKSVSQDKTAVAAAAMTNIWHETHCMDVVFDEEQGAESNLHMLTSRTWIEECRPIGHPHGGCIPNRRPWSHVASFIIEIPARAAGAPAETFEVCMNGPWLQKPRVKKGPHRYSVSQRKEGSVTRFTLKKAEPKKK
jgi:hypothetical protein